jgi:hypothetical protein
MFGDESKKTNTDLGESGEDRVWRGTVQAWYCGRKEAVWIDRSTGKLSVLVAKEAERGGETEGGGGGGGARPTRIVLRQEGSLRVVLNVRVPPGAPITEVGSRSVRLIAGDDGGEGGVGAYLLRVVGDSETAASLAAALRSAVGSTAPPPPSAAAPAASSSSSTSPSASPTSPASPSLSTAQTATTS